MDREQRRDGASSRHGGAALAVAAALVTLAGCGGGIPLDEEGVFEAKRSITPATFERSDAELEETSFGADPELHAWSFERDGARCTTLFFGGQRFHMVLARERVESVLDRVPVDLFMFDYRGYGRSDGEPTVEGLKADALDAYDYATETLGTDCVIAHGHSLGTFLATWVATERDVDGLVLEAPVVSAQRFVRTLVPWYLRLFIGFDIDPAFQGENNAERIAEVDAPTLLIAGSDDPIAPPSHARELRKRSAGNPVRLGVVEGAEHNDLYTHEEFGSRYRRLLCEIGRCPSEAEAE